MPSAIVDYGMGNLFNLQRALAFLGHAAEVTADPAKVEAAERIFLPGVGAFPKAMEELAARGLAGPVKRHAACGKPLLGICLGMQLLFSRGEEFGDHAGLDILPGRVVRLSAGEKVKLPQIGWNRAEPLAPASPFWAGAWPGRDFYFVHSFVCRPDSASDASAETEYGGDRFCSVANRGKVWGCQFHPERSGPNGLEFLKRFIAL